MKRFERSPTVEQVMIERPIRATPDDAVETLIEMMIERGVGDVPVVDRHERLLGMVTESDVMREGWQPSGRRVELREPASHQRGFRGEPKSRAAVGDIMTPFAFALPGTAPLVHAAALMAHEGVHRIAVTDHDRKLIGMVTSVDVMRWVARSAGFMISDRDDRVPVTVSRPVMIVDDDPDLRADYEEVIREEGYSVVTAANGEEAMARLGAGDAPGLIILDLNMPVMDGWTFRSELLRDPQKAQIPVVLLSGHHELGNAMSDLEADGCLRKPVSLNQLLFTVDHYCRN